MTDDKTLLAECAAALRNLPEFTGMSVPHSLDVASTILALARPRIEAEALERAAVECDKLHCHHVAAHIRTLMPKESTDANG